MGTQEEGLDGFQRYCSLELWSKVALSLEGLKIGRYVVALLL